MIRRVTGFAPVMRQSGHKPGRTRNGRVLAWENDMKIRNLMGRDLTVFVSTAPDAPSVVLSADGPAPRWSGAPGTPGKEAIEIEGRSIPVSRAPAPTPDNLGTVTGLPDPEEGTLLLVPYPVEVWAWLTGRTDCRRMGPMRFGPDGKPIGADGFARS